MNKEILTRIEVKSNKGFSFSFITNMPPEEIEKVESIILGQRKDYTDNKTILFICINLVQRLFKGEMKTRSCARAYVEDVWRTR